MSYFVLCISRHHLLLCADIVLASGNRNWYKTSPALLIFLKCMIYPWKSWLRCLRFVCLFLWFLVFPNEAGRRKGDGFWNFYFENSHDFLKWNFSRADRWIRGPHIWIPFPRSSHAAFVKVLILQAYLWQWGWQVIYQWHLTSYSERMDEHV